MKRIKVKKGQYLQRKGDLHTSVYEVESGLLRSYSIDEKGKEHIFMFAPEGWIMADNTLPNKPSQLYIDALEDSIILKKEKTLDNPHDFEKLIRRMGTLQHRIIMLMSAPAIERYQHFVDTYPDIIQRVPQKLIASYLGITPEGLSAVKKSFHDKKH